MCAFYPRTRIMGPPRRLFTLYKGRLVGALRTATIPGAPTRRPDASHFETLRCNGGAGAFNDRLQSLLPFASYLSPE